MKNENINKISHKTLKKNIKMFVLWLVFLFFHKFLDISSYTTTSFWAISGYQACNLLKCFQNQEIFTYLHDVFCKIFIKLSLFITFWLNSDMINIGEIIYKKACPLNLKKYTLNWLTAQKWVVVYDVHSHKCMLNMMKI